jgi:hypothetical protein
MIFFVGFGITPLLHAIAGGLLAEQSHEGGTQTAILGAFLQEFMGVLIAGIYVGATFILPTLRRRWIRFGLAYGVVIFFVMNYVVLPLSAWRTVPHFSVAGFAGNMVAMLLFGCIVAYFASRQPDSDP